LTLHMLHGCTKTWKFGAQVTRNFVSESALESFLRQADRHYVHWPDDNRDPHVLSVDDSTRGAASACRMARALGHEVMIFVNPQQIAHGREYWFSRLDAILDGRRRDVVSFQGRRFELDARGQIRALRLAVKEQMRLLSEAAGGELLGELAGALRAGFGELEEHAQTMTTSELIDLYRLGVMVESHGWGHRDISRMTSTEFAEDIAMTERWLVEQLGIRPRHYAVPFGTDLLTHEQRAVVNGPIMLATHEFRDGLVGDNYWNRTEITDRLQDAS
jgi:Polysaccharide deacetylase